MKPKVSIILLNWNGAKDTLECLASLNKITYDNFDVIVVDNNSDENDKQLLEKTEINKSLYVIYNRSNLGYAEGNNIGIKKAITNESDFILLLNNDTIVEPNFLEPLLDMFNKNNDLGIAAPQINYYNNPTKIWSEGGKISKIRSSGFAYSERMDNSENMKDAEVGFVSGCCMLIKKELFKIVGNFDEKFYLYVEDTDLCYRTCQAGYKIYVSHKSKIYHKVSASTNESLTQLPLYYVTRNRLYFAKKNVGLIFYYVLIYLLVTFFFKFIYWLFTNQSQKLKIVIKAFSDFFKGKMGQAFLL